MPVLCLTAIPHLLFIVVPDADPAHRSGLQDVVAALKAIYVARAPFVSRGDNSGTNALEKRLWKAADMNPVAAEAGWYRDIGGGMTAALATIERLQDGAVFGHIDTLGTRLREGFNAVFRARNIPIHARNLGSMVMAHLVVPYSQANNDSKFARGPFGTAQDYETWDRDALDFLCAEGEVARRLDIATHWRSEHPPQSSGGSIGGR